MIDIVKDADTTDVLHYATLTGLVNEIKSPNSFLRNRLFTRSEVCHTEKIELSVLVGAREIAPFVQKHNEAVFVTGYGEKLQTIEPPNIRIKRVIHPHKLINERRAGMTIFPTQQQHLSSMQSYMAQQGQRLADLCSNSEEWLCAQILRGQITYQVTEQENYRITVPRPSGNNVAAAIGWDDPDPSLPTIEQDFYTAKKIISDEVGLIPTDVILGETAAAAFQNVLKNQKLLDMLHFRAGEVTLQNQFRPDGALLLGEFCGIPVWTYPRQVVVNGTAQPLIRADYAEFVCADPAAENVIYFGPIDDDAAIEGGSFATPRFSKSWTTPDPSQRLMLVHTRPLPWARRPGSMVSMQVTG